MGSAVHLSDVAFGFGSKPILANVSLTLPPGASASIVGRSGVGKTTLLRLIAGLVRPASGAVLIDGRSPDQLHAERAIAFLFQEPSLWPQLSVRRTLEVTYELHELLPDPQRIEHVLDEVGLTHSEALLPHQLSVGMKARLAIARAFCIPPRLLLMDEPFAAIDALRRPELNRSVQSIRMRSGCSVIWVTHDIVEALQYADYIITLRGIPATVASIHALPVPRVAHDANALPSNYLSLRDTILAGFDDTAGPE